MDGTRFDQVARRLDRVVSRRRGLRGAVAGLLGGLAGPSAVTGAAASRRPRRRKQEREFSAEGPCGDGSAKANACQRHTQCCTGYCHRKRQRCRCRRQGQSCTQSRNCCRRGGQQLSCQRGTCRPVLPPVRCGPDGPCRVFVTSTGQTGALGGLDGADDICQGLAAEAGLPGTYRAWLSDATESPATRFPNTEATGPYVLVDAAATEIAADWADLTDGELAAPIDVTETGATVGFSGVWTNTETNGTAAHEGDRHCANWMEGDSGGFGLTGHSDRTDSDWTRFAGAFCGVQRGLYCFQQG